MFAFAYFALPQPCSPSFCKGPLQPKSIPAFRPGLVKNFPSSWRSIYLCCVPRAFLSSRRKRVMESSAIKTGAAYFFYLLLSLLHSQSYSSLNPTLPNSIFASASLPDLITTKQRLGIPPLSTSQSHELIHPPHAARKRVQ